MDLVAAQQLWEPVPGWLNTASYGLPPKPAWDALQAALDDWRVGRTSWEPWDEATQRCRAAYARLINVHLADVAVGSAVSQLVAPIAAAIPAGTRVVLPEVDFTSIVFPWAAHGLDVVAVPVEKLADAVDANTGVIAFSLVQSADGTIAAYEDIVAAARAAGALVIVDATQACGWLPIDGSLADAVLTGGYKWLMGPRGTAYGYYSPALRERMTPSAAGWYAAADVHSSYYGLPMRLAEDARRFDISPAWHSFVGSAPALELIEEVGVAAIRDHNVRLADRFLAGLGKPPAGSAIVTVDVPDAKDKLARAGIRAAVRAGRVRASFHVYSTDHDVDLALEALG
ncbi:aminotransferase class V-fold PLP-dependent enzyme [Asanoa sp. WMMD1127]|uniref:aminotransferase class V-fold PLP-dependent enzyme n=1 Tax=Asanoa sp. WMMD1127 TaxID=3016107 RepID=UPI002415998F|nr:aminotransferase class V-fold PLP-dependent enzyme [Asanoa sp. WMMD1127]MDG4824395.1 aminotransferase class V-fold PLP-dependent enzyme [Asanoa sp. WMMD1127]